MNRLKEAWAAQHPVVHLLMAGTVFVMLTQSMSMPFLAIMLSETTSLSPAEIGVIIGAGPLAGMVGGFLGGLLSDLFGRRKLMLLSMLLMAVAFAGFVVTNDPFILLLNSILRGLASAFFGTVSKALMGDLTPEDKRFRVFANRYLAINLGFSIGPMLGAFLGIAGSGFTFVLTAMTYLLFAGLLSYVCKKYRVGDAPGQLAEKPQVAKMWQVLGRDVVLLMFVLGGVLLVTVHGQMSVTLSQYLQQNIKEGVALFSVMMSVNGVTVLLLQAPLTRWAERLTLFRRMVGGVLLMAAGEVGFAFSQEWSSFIIAMIVFTLGEILIVPAEYAQIDQISPAHMRGTYYGAQSFSELGNFLGPWAGGMILSTYGGTVMFLVMAALAVISLVFYGAGRSLYEKKQRRLASPVSAG
ncbi:MDR family MFS transporter [Brevibacillus borstelensis]|jgi:MFS family permease|uniref:MDR family MFS transporter n=1 Tax=Brevibacillus borstelensis TaxID=45462 RepID=UPI000F088DE4|nr:MFS transporter [Brevibacillus borstelensis]MCC0566120.1 MFS transporter [Brevibacillus borstelensis]MCM3472890.1 MFS transporter [Brevibacillus borstelensis]MCM3560834.1 MFS transporter [Brevibacillus borstelensis]MCM3592761.1 MFS transporter [Brevibacillus borstelensis]MCM3624365.1 MFS transporter [Brevibacillus borstelensis]